MILTKDKGMRMWGSGFGNGSGSSGGSGGGGGSAAYADEAGHAAEADHATNADDATNAGYATNAGHADSADDATHATSAANLDTDSTDWLKIARKDIEQTIAEVWTFAKGIVSTLRSYFNGGATIAKASGDTGNALVVTGGTQTDTLQTTENATVGGTLGVSGKLTGTTADFTDVTMDNLGEELDRVAKIWATDISTENLEVTKEAHFFRLVVDELLSNKGAIIISSANCVAEVVRSTTDYQILFSKKDANGNDVSNPWKVGDLAICLTFKTEGAGTFANVHNRYYWRKVLAVGTTTYDSESYYYVTLSNQSGEYDGTTVPAPGDNIVQLGYTGNDAAYRQSATILSSYPTMDSGVTPPSLAFYKGINDFTLSSHRKTFIDSLNNDFVGNFRVTSDRGEKPVSVCMGTWTEGSVSHYGYQWEYNGAMWTYINESSSTTEAPGTTAANWLQNKGPQGDSVYCPQVFQAASSQPLTPTGSAIPPSGWSLIPPVAVGAISSSGRFYNAYDDHAGWRVAYGNGNSGVNIIDRATFTTTIPDQVIVIEIEASSEAKYDFIQVGGLDETITARPPLVAGRRASGTQKIQVVTVVPTAGSHYLDIIYSKDSTTSVNKDCAWYRLITSAQIWSSTAKLVNGVLDGSWSTPVEWNAQTEQTHEIIANDERISLSLNRGWRNYVLTPKAVDAYTDSVTSASIVDDPLFGPVYQIYYSGGGNFQLWFTFDESRRSELVSKKVTVFAVVKPVTAGPVNVGVCGNASAQQKADLVQCTALNAGLISSVGSGVSGATPYLAEIGSGWYLVAATFDSGTIFNGQIDGCGINSINGSTWQIYSIGIIQSDACPSLYSIITNSGLRSTGIDITDGLIDLRADKVTFTNSAGTVSGKVSIDPTKGTLITQDAVLRGNLFLPYTRITQDNWSDYGTYNSNVGTIFNLLGEVAGKTAAGLNLQIEYIQTVASVTSTGHVRLPDLTDKDPESWLGCEINILNATTTEPLYVRGSYNSSGNFGLTNCVNGTWYSDHNVGLSIGGEGKFKLIKRGTVYCWICCYANLNQ